MTISHPANLSSDWACEDCDAVVDNKTVCDLFNMADTVNEDTKVDDDDDDDEQIMKLEAAIYKLSFLVHHNNYWNIQVDPKGHKNVFYYMTNFCSGTTEPDRQICSKITIVKNPVAEKNSTL